MPRPLCVASGGEQCEWHLHSIHRKFWSIHTPSILFDSINVLVAYHLRVTTCELQLVSYNSQILQCASWLLFSAKLDQFFRLPKLHNLFRWLYGLVRTLCCDDWQSDRMSKRLKKSATIYTILILPNSIHENTNSIHWILSLNPIE